MRYQRLPSTIDNEIETSWPFPKMFVTNDEIGMMLMGAGLGAMVSLPIMKGASPFTLVFGAVGLFAMARWIKGQKERRNRVPSWLYDWRLETGLLRPQRSIMKTRGGRYVLTAHPQAGLAVFATGARKPGEDLCITYPWQRHRAPTLRPRPLLPPRILARFDLSAKAPAPAWFPLAERFEKIVRPTMQGRIVEEVVPWDPKSRG